MKCTHAVRGRFTLRVSIVFASLVFGLILFCAITPMIMAQTTLKPEPALTVREPITLPFTTQPTAAALDTWRKTMHHTSAPVEFDKAGVRQGCFHASYPSTQWQAVQCAPANGYRSTRPRRLNHLEVGGATYPQNDIVVQAPVGHLLSNVLGSFPSVSGVNSVTSVGVPAYGGGGILGANEYTLQINTNITHSSACGGYTNCTVWQQYVMSTNTPVSLTSNSLTNETEVFIEYWLFDYGSGPNMCPAGFVDAGPDQTGPGDDCVQNTPATVVYNGQIQANDANLADMSLSGSATAGGTDAATVTYGGEAYTATVPDSYTDVASIWNQAEFNIVGNAGGSQAVFNNGSTLVVQSSVTYNPTSTSAPICVDNGGTTGESNNLNIAPAPGTTTPPTCCPFGGASPSIEFVESNNAGEWASCGNPITWGDPHITTVNGTYYDFQGAGEYVTLQDPDGTEVQVRQSPIVGAAAGNYAPNPLPPGTSYQNDGLVSCLSSNTAVAARVGTHRVTYEPSFGVPNPSGLQLRVDGKVTTTGVNFGNGGSVEKNSDGIVIDFPDGKILSVTGTLPYLSLDFSSLGVVSKSAGASESGLAGVVPAGNWLPRLPNGTALGPMPAALHARYVTLNQTFGNAWRVTSGNSLFDYAPGTSTATFTNASWPVENAKTCTLPNTNVRALPPISAEAAEEACKSISNATLRSSCEFDVQATGNNSLADTYSVTDRVHTNLLARPIIKPVLTEIK